MVYTKEEEREARAVGCLMKTVVYSLVGIGFVVGVLVTAVIA